jgi:tetratricopeptide (TPR) repeat protein
MNLKSSQRAVLFVIAILLFIPVALLQSRIDPQRAQYLPGEAKYGNGSLSQLPIQFALGGLIGFREAIAGLLWVRCDDFFDQGNYSAITPLIRIITWLDPHQIDVYETGAWHMDYNFTDSFQRSDRRYIPLSLALMREGIANNPNVPDMYADLAFTHYFRKIGDYPMAKVWYVKGQAVDDSQRAATANDLSDSNDRADAKAAAQSVTTLGHMLAHTYEALGEIPEAIKQWQYCIQMHQWNITHNTNEKYPEQFGLKASQRGMYEDERRMVWRARDTKVPVNMEFHPELVRVAPKIFVLKGTMHVIGNIAKPKAIDGKQVGFLENGQAVWGPVDGCRVEIRLNDLGYKMPYIPSFNLSSINLNPDVTIMQDSASVLKDYIGGTRGRKIDMSQDPDIYSFTAPKYQVTLWFDPSDPNDCPINVQDRIGWLGQGMTDSDPSVIDISGLVPGDTGGIPIKGLKIFKKTFTLTRADILGLTKQTVWQ